MRTAITSVLATVLATLPGCGFSITADTTGGDGGPVVVPDTAVADADLSMPQADASPNTPIDAPVPQPLVCPAGYQQIGSSYYRIIDDARGFKLHSLDCYDDQAGATHLAVIDNAAEAQALLAKAAMVPNVNSNSRFYVGAVQSKLTLQPDEGWIDITDGALAELWHTGEPDDGPDNNEINHQEQVGALALDKTYLVDLSHEENIRAICECDGKAVGPLATGIVVAM